MGIYWNKCFSHSVIKYVYTLKKCVEWNVLFNDTLNIFYFTVIWCQTYDKGPLRLQERKPAAATWITLSDQQQGFVYMHHPTDMHHPRQDNTYHCLCYTSLGALAATRNSSMGPPWRIDPTTHSTTKYVDTIGFDLLFCWLVLWGGGGGGGGGGDGGGGWLLLYNNDLKVILKTEV